MLRRLVFGGRVPTGGVLARRWPFLPIVVATFLLGVSAFLLVALVDPYDVRPWGLQPRLADHRYPDVEWPLLINPITAGDYDTVLIGSSTMMAVTPAQMRRAFGARTRPVNLSYPLSAPADLAKTLAAAERLPKLRHVILVIDHSQMLPMKVSFMPARMRDNVWSTSWSHAGDFTLSTAQASLNRLTDGVYDLGAWALMTRPNFMSKGKVVSDPAAMRRMAGAIERYGPTVLGQPADPRCDRWPFFAKVLTPGVQRLLARGIKVDLLLPPYPIVSYYDWIERRFYNDPFEAGPVYPQLTAFRRCAVDVSARFGGSAPITAIDNNLAITNRLENYTDNVHLINPAAYQRMLDHVAAGDARLSAANFDAYQAQLERNILALRRTPPAGLEPAGLTKPQP